MNFADTIYVSCAAYSCIHPNRAAALNHLFLCYGNGYGWHNGQLVDVCEGRKLLNNTAAEHIAFIFDERRKRDEEHKRWEAERQEKRKREKPNPEDEKRVDALMKSLEAVFEAQRKLKESDPEKYEKLMAEREAEHQKLLDRMAEDEKWEYCVPDNIDERLQDTNYNTWHPMAAQYSYLVNFPDDIQPDWLDAIVETAHLVLKQRGTTSAYKDHPGATEKCIAENERLARLALDKAHALYLKRGQYAPDSIEVLKGMDGCR